MATIFKILYWLWQIGNLFFSQKARDKEIKKLETRITEIENAQKELNEKYRWQTTEHPYPITDYQRDWGLLDTERKALNTCLGKLNRKKRTTISIEKG